MPGYIPRYCIECLFFKELEPDTGRCTAWRNERQHYARICGRFVEYRHFDPFTGELVLSTRKETKKCVF